MTITEEITRELMAVDAEVAAEPGHRRYALEAGMRICAIPAVRVLRVDSAELVGFIRNTIEADTTRGYDQLADAVVARFALTEEFS